MFDRDLQEVIRAENRDFIKSALERAAAEVESKAVQLSPPENPPAHSDIFRRFSRQRVGIRLARKPETGNPDNYPDKVSGFGFLHSPIFINASGITESLVEQVSLTSLESLSCDVLSGVAPNNALKGRRFESLTAECIAPPESVGRTVSGPRHVRAGRGGNAKLGGGASGLPRPANRKAVKSSRAPRVRER